MRKSEPDSKHFVKIRGNLRLPCQNLQKPQKKCANYLLCGFLRNWPIGIDENMFPNWGISKNQTSRWINFWRSWAMKFCGDGLCGCTIHLRNLFYMKYYLCKKNSCALEASGYLVGFSETAPHMVSSIYSDPRSRVNVHWSKKFSKTILGASKTCFTSVRGVLEPTIFTQLEILKHFAKKNIKKYKKIEKLDLSDFFWDFLKILKNSSIFF